MPLILPALLLAALPFTRNDDKCQPFESSKKLPSVNVLFDSASLVSQLASHENGAVDELVVSINLQRGTAHVFGTAASPANDSIVALALVAVRPNVKDAPTSIRLRIQQKPSIAFTVQRSVLCAPVSIDGKHLPAGPIRFGVQRESSGRSSRTPSAVMQMSQSITPRFLINKSGEIVTVEMGMGSGMRDADTSMRDEFLTYRFKPALLDGEAVEVWLAGKRIDIAN